MRFAVIPFLAIFMLAIGAFSPTSALAAPSFERDIFPILKENCAGCHSNLEKKAKGGLSLDTQKEMLKGGEDGAIFIAGKPDESPLIKMITGPKPEMPKKQPPLPAAQVKLLRDWVAAGAVVDTWPVVVERAPVIPAVYRFAPAVSSLAFSPDGQTLAAACRSEIVLIAMDHLKDDAAPKRLATDCDLLTWLEFSPDGKMLAGAGGTPARYGEVRFLRPDTGELVAARRITRDTLFHGNFSPDGKTVAVGAADGAVYFVPVDPAGAVRSAELHSDWVLAVAFSPDGKWIISGGRDKATKVSLAETGALLATVDMSTEMVTAVASDGQFGVSINRKGDLISYEYKIALSGVEVNGSGNGAEPVNKRGQYAKNFEAQSGEIVDLATSRDRKLIAVSSAGGEVRVYKIADRTRVATVAKAPPGIYSIALNAAGTRLAIGTKSGLVNIYDLPAGTLVKSLTPVPVNAAGH